MKTDLALEDLKRKKFLAKIIDDICVQAPTFTELMERLELVIDRCRTHGIKLSIAKFEIGQSVKFAGFLVTSEGMRPDPAELKALSAFPSPNSAFD